MVNWAVLGFILVINCNDLFTYWTPSCGQKGPVIYSLSILSPEHFPGIGSLVNFKTQHGVKGACKMDHKQNFFILLEKFIH